MADKEITVFLVDAKAPATYTYLYNVLAQKLLKGLKTDYVSVVEFHAASTEHAAADSGKFQGIRVLADFEVVTFEKLQKLQNELDQNSTSTPQAPPNASDAVQTVLFASTLLGPTKKKVFVRNIVVLTEYSSPTHSDSAQKVDSVPTFYNQLEANLHFIVSDPDSAAAGKQHPLFESLMDQFGSSSINSINEAMQAFTTRPPVKKTRPLAVYKGQFRFGADSNALDPTSDYDASSDSLCACFNVEMYPAVKSESSSSSAHEYLVDSGHVTKVDRKTSYFVWERNDHGDRIGEDDGNEPDPADDPDVEKNYDKKFVELDGVTPGFKFSNFDLIALDSDLQDATRLRLSSALDIVGFIASDSVPYSHFTDEAMYIVPEKVSSLINIRAFGSFVEALHEKKLAALCRFVRKQEKEVEVGAAFPVKVFKNEKFTFCLVFIRLPFKEDEKIGNFPTLQKKDENESKENALMESFIDAKSVSGPEFDLRDEIDNFKVTMQGSGKLPLPQTFKSDPFTCSSPAAHRYSLYLQKILLKSLKAENWVQHFENPNFIRENLMDEEHATNFFNVKNCLSINSSADTDMLAKLSKASADSAKRLVEELDIKYVRKDELKKQKKSEPGESRKGDYGADEGNYASVPDFDL